MLERQEEEARSPIFCPLPLVEMTPCRHRILRLKDVAERKICEIPGPAQSLTSKSLLCNPLGKASSLLQSYISSLVSFAQGNPPSGKRMPKCSRRDELYLLLLLLLLWMPSSTVKVLILPHSSMNNVLRLGGSWTPAIYLNEWQLSIYKISRDEFVSHIHASGNDFSASHSLISIFFNLEGRATSGKESRELQPPMNISLKELRLSSDCGSFTRPSHMYSLRYSSLHENSQSFCRWSSSSSATKD
ncbi:hypothetical protein CUMW_232850 [Citrus unshiu]|uniref:Uncharacterized protein n=1 Tax=Citrus unshiu TaxID=55188 RepID=A0A2H5QI98_CITUN|nr:hypothetical protein CUMW_232850 [Citrus unshiu]